MEMVTHTEIIRIRTSEYDRYQYFRFPRPVVQAHLALAGFEATYAYGDHHVQRLKVMLDRLVDRDALGSFVRVRIRAHLRDKNADDHWQGSVRLVLFAELAGALPPVVA